MRHPLDDHPQKRPRLILVISAYRRRPDILFLTIALFFIPILRCGLRNDSLTRRLNPQQGESQDEDEGSSIGDFSFDRFFCGNGSRQVDRPF
jgi:hypothetical protein